MRIAVLLTTFNRREQTLRCLSALQSQSLPPGTDLSVFLTDDQSADGTAAAVRKAFPQTTLFEGTGSLFWAGGMRHTWRMAMKTEPDFFLLLNDDTTLFSDAVSSLLAVAQKKPGAICIGSTRDESSGLLSYGGWKITASKRWQSEKVFSPTDILSCDFANANIMLVPAEVASINGVLSDRFTHALADYDYCLRAKRNGFNVVLAPGFQGSCTDDHQVNWVSAGSPLAERIKYLHSPKGLNYTEYLWFIRTYFPLSYPAAFLKLWLKTLLPVIWDRFKKMPGISIAG